MLRRDLFNKIIIVLVADELVNPENMFNVTFVEQFLKSRNNFKSEKVQECRCEGRWFGSEGAEG